mmetsp:Transcript_54731/g.144597  ORF Transcript_54731/g.144597 Transcript_54731/m.144597 type:complete len:218 (+) Transcript_54731:422-1075(+)
MTMVCTQQLLVGSQASIRGSNRGHLVGTTSSCRRSGSLDSWTPWRDCSSCLQECASSSEHSGWWRATDSSTSAPGPTPWHRKARAARLPWGGSLLSLPVGLRTNEHISVWSPCRLGIERTRCVTGARLRCSFSGGSEGSARHTDICCLELPSRLTPRARVQKLYPIPPRSRTATECFRHRKPPCRGDVWTSSSRRPSDCTRCSGTSARSGLACREGA